MKNFHQPLSKQELLALLSHLQQQDALIEWAVLLGCLTLAWFASRMLRGTLTQSRSIWFGRHIVDGVLFPAVTLCMALVGQHVLLGGVPEAVFKLALPILSTWALVVASTQVLGAVFPQSQLMRQIEQGLIWLACAGVVLWVTGVLPMIMDELGDITWRVGAATISVRNLIEGSISAIVVMVVVLWLSAGLEERLLRGATFETLSFRKIVANASRAGLILLGLLLALSIAGVDLTALSVFGGAIGVGLGFGLQKLAANYVSGFVILAERSLRIGDMVKIDGFEGRITDIKTRYTVLRSLTGRESIVPNELLISQRVENASLADPHVLLTTVILVAYGTDLTALRPQLVAAVSTVARVISEPAPAVYLSSFAADGLELTIAFWIADPENSQMSVRSEVNLAVLDSLQSMEVIIPYPQRVMHLRTQGEVKPQ